MNMKIKKMYKKIDKFLDKKISYADIISWFILFIIVFSVIIACVFSPNNYDYVDTNDNAGKSTNCYKEKDGLYCDIKTPVKQYS